MSLSNSIFGKDLTDITINDLKLYFQKPREETNLIEYKSFHQNGEFEKKLQGIYKAICAMLNSEGGLLIWGAPSGKKVPNKKEEIFEGELTLINEILEKDALINRISHNITPLPNGIIVRIIEQDKGCLCIFEVLKSQYSPHQTGNIYYMRLDGQSIPAPHHYIEALFKQIKYPNVGGYIKFLSIDKLKEDRGFWLNIQVFIMNHSTLQNDENVFILLSAYPGKFPQFTVKDATSLMDGHQLELQDFAKILHQGGIPSREYIVKYTLEELESKKELRLMLMFGGRKSPMKVSDYTLSPDHLKAQNIENLLIDYKENTLMNDSGKQKLSEEEKVAFHLGRKNMN